MSSANPESKSSKSIEKGRAPQQMLNNVCTATKILEKRRQAAEVQDALDAQKHEFLRKIDIFQRREDAIRRKDLMLQESLIKFNKFLLENEYKRTRALRR